MIGVSIPIAIHLWNRKSGRVIKVGSVRFLHASESSSYSSLRLTEVMLLLLRILLIFLLSLIMSGAYYLSSNSNIDYKTILIDQKLKNEGEYVSLFDSLAQYESHDLNTYVDTLPLDYWQIIKALGDRSGEEFVVYSSNPLHLFKGKKVMLPRNVKWIYLPLNNKTFIVGAQRFSTDSVLVILGNSNSEVLKIDKYKRHYSTLTSRVEIGGIEVLFDRGGNQFIYDGDSIPISQQPIIKCRVVYDDEFEDDVAYIDAAFKAITTSGSCTINGDYVRTSDYIAESADWFFWLSKEEPLVEGNVVLFGEEYYNNGIFLPNQYLIEYRVNPRYTSMTLLSAFPETIVELFLKDQFNTQRSKYDRRSVDYRQLRSSDTPDEITITKKQLNLSSILWPLFFIVLIVERIVSAKRKQ